MDPEVLLISEHWQSEAQLKAQTLPNYQLASCFCREVNRHGGVAIFVKISANFRRVSRIADFSVSGVCECCAVEDGAGLLIICIYRPPNDGAAKVESFMSAVDSILSFACTSGHYSRIVIGGDLNINVLTDSPLHDQFRDAVGSFNFRVLIREPTRVTPTSATAIDNFVVNMPSEVKCTPRVVRTFLSDHFGILLLIHQTTPVETTKKFIWRRCFHRARVEAFCRLLREERWVGVYEDDSPETAYNAFLDIFLKYFNQCFPPRKFQLRPRPLTPMTPEILELKQLVAAYGEFSLKYPEFKQLFSETNTKYRQLIEETKRQRLDATIENSQNKSRAMWEAISTLTGKCPKQGIEHSLLDPELPNKFNQFFSSIAGNVTSHLSPIVDYDFIHDLTPPVASVFEFLPTTVSEVESAIAALKSSSSTGPDGVPSTLLKQCSHLISAPLSHVFNTSLQAGHVPTRMKEGTVKPFLKQGDPQDVTNYRPISLISTFSKIFERIVNKRLVTYLEQNSILSPCQHGFRQLRSTETALIDFIEQIVSHIDKKQIALGIYIDFSKAFDCVNHEILLLILQNLGVQGNAHRWFSSYLSDRRQSVVLSDGIRTAISDTTLVMTGVPQGSVLGPTLYLVYANSLQKHLSSLGSKDPNITSTVVTYADDTNILVGGQTMNSILESSSSTLSLLYEWIDKNKLVLNAAKTTCTIFRSSRSQLSVGDSIVLNGQTVASATSSRLLGLRVDSGLRWGDHIDELCGRLSSVIYALRSLSRQCSPYILMSLYYACFYSHLRFGIVHWGLSADVNRVFILQKRALRVIHQLPHRQTCRETFREQGILTLPCIYIFEVLLHVFQNKDKFLRNTVDHEHSTRSRGIPLADRHSTSLYQKSLFFNGCKLYRALPQDIREVSTLATFKVKVKRMLIEKTCYSVSEFFP